MTGNRQFEIVAETELYRGFFNLSRLQVRHGLFNGGVSPILERELFHRGACVAVLPYDPIADTVVLIEQFRTGPATIGVNPWLLEVVAGAVEPGETPADVAYREAIEEAGCQLSALIPIHNFFPTPGGCSERVTLFCGIVDASQVGGIYGLAEENEDILVHVLPYATAMEWLGAGRINTGVTIIALQWLALNRAELLQPPASAHP